MATKKYQSIDEMIAFKKSERLTTANIKALREQFVKDMQELYKAKGWNMGTDQQYEGETVRLYEEKSYTWETNHHIDSEVRALYCGYKAQEDEHSGDYENGLAAIPEAPDKGHYVNAFLLLNRGVVVLIVLVHRLLVCCPEKVPGQDDDGDDGRY